MPKRKAVAGDGIGRYRGKTCVVKGCYLGTLTPTTEYCAVHFQKLVGKPGLKDWLKNT